MFHAKVGRLIALSFVVAINTINPTYADDTTISCKSPPKEGASVAVHPGTQVSTTQDTQNGTCIFSINGAVATSPPSKEVMDALNLVRAPDFRILREPNSAPYAIAALLAAPSPVDEVPQDLVNALKSAGPILWKCLYGFFTGNRLSTEVANDGAFSCETLEAYSNAESKSAMLRRTGIAVATPTLVISVKWRSGRFVSTAYLPRPK